MRQLMIVFLLTALSGSTAYAQNPWYWEVSPPEPTTLDTVKIDMAFYSDYNLSFESNHSVNDTIINVNIDVLTGMLPISGWFFHSEEIGRLAAGHYNCRTYVDYYLWNMGGWWEWVGSDYSSGSFDVRPIGDVNGDGLVNLADLVCLVEYLYIGGTAPDPVEIGDATCDGVVNLGDVIFLVNYLYRGGPAPNC